MRYDSDRFWNCFWGSMFGAFVLFCVVALLGAAINHGRNSAVQDCIGFAKKYDEIDLCQKLRAK